MASRPSGGSASRARPRRRGVASGGRARGWPTGGDRAPTGGRRARGRSSAVAEADGVVVAGGGNLASTWPLHVYERAALAGIAARLRRPLVSPDRPSVRRCSAATASWSASCCGRRGSSACASRLARAGRRAGLEARVGVDDASFLGMRNGCRAGTERCARQSVARPRWRTRERRPSTASPRLVDAAAETVGGPVRFHAHYGPLARRRAAGRRGASRGGPGPDAHRPRQSCRRAVRGKPHPSPGPPRC